MNESKKKLDPAPWSYFRCPSCNVSVWFPRAMSIAEAEAKHACGARYLDGRRAPARVSEDAKVAS